MSAQAPHEPIRAYGDRKDDGRIQLSFTLPVAAVGARQGGGAPLRRGARASRTCSSPPWSRRARAFASSSSTATPTCTLDFAEIEVPEVTVPAWGFKEINHLIHEQLGRKVVVVGACTGSDAHTVGIDAILNMKGYAGDKGLEAYPWIDAYNLGAQVDNVALLARAKELHADAVLVSQIMTQRDLHIENSQQLIELARKQRHARPAVPPRRAAHRSQAGARARLRRRLRPRHQAVAGGELHRRHADQAAAGWGGGEVSHVGIGIRPVVNSPRLSPTRRTAAPAPAPPDDRAPPPIGAS